jgi:hypothetical protein
MTLWMTLSMVLARPFVAHGYTLMPAVRKSSAFIHIRYEAVNLMPLCRNIFRRYLVHL